MIRRVVVLVTLLGAATLTAAGPVRGQSEPEGFRELEESGRESQTVAQAGAYAYMAHAGPIGDLGPAARLAAAHEAAALPVSPVAGGWREVGPIPYNNDDPTYPSSLGPFGIVSGQVISLAVDPTDANTVYAGGASGGIWKSTDAGAHWTPIGDNLASLAIGALAVDPANHKTVFAGTGNANTNFDAYSGAGVYRSRDAGATWVRVDRNVGPAATIFHIEIAGGRIFVATNKGLYRSTDGGDSYAEVPLPTNAAGTAKQTGDFANFVTDVRVKPGTPSEVTAAVGWRTGKPLSPGNGLYRSTNGGGPGSFTRMTTIGLGVPSSDNPLGRISLAYASGPDQDRNILWAIVQDAELLRLQRENPLDMPLPGTTVLNGIFRSGDDGATWMLKATPPNLIAAPGTALVVRGILLYIAGVQAWYNQWIAVDPGSVDTVLVGLEEIYKTTLNANLPGPAAWETIGRYAEPCPELPTIRVPPCPPLLGAFGPDDFGLPGGPTTHPDQHAVAMVQTPSGTRAYVGNDGGVWRQDAVSGAFDNDHWTGLNASLGTLQPYRAAMGADGTIYFGLQDNGVGKTTGPTTGSAVLGGDGMNVAVDPVNSKIAYAEGPGADLNRTTDGGVTWNSIAPSLTQAQFVTPFDLDPLDRNHFIIAGREVLVTTAIRTVDGGGFAQVFDLGQNADGFNFSATATALRGAAAYVGFCGVCDPITEAATDLTKFRNGIATNVTPNCEPIKGAGRCWRKAPATGLPNRFISDLAIDATDPRVVFATLGGYNRRWYAPPASAPGIGSGHLYVSRNGGDTFVDVSGNLPDSPATSIILRGNAVIVGTDDGVFAALRTATGVGPFARLGNGLPHVPIWDLQLDPSGRHLVTATHGRGVWVYDFLASLDIPVGVIPATGRPTPVVVLPLLLAAAILRRVSRGRGASYQRRARSAR